MNTSRCSFLQTPVALADADLCSAFLSSLVKVGGSWEATCLLEFMLLLGQTVVDRVAYLSLPFLEMRNPGSRPWQIGSLIGEPASWFIEGHLLPGSHIMERVRGLSRVTQSILEDPPHDLETSQRLHLLIPSPWGLGFQHTSLEGMWTFIP